MEAKYIPPLRAIRLHCYDCSAFSWPEVERCTVIDCVLWPWRFGKRPETAEARGKLVDPYEASGKEHGKGQERDTYKIIENPLWWETGVVNKTSVSEAA
jgi:hypothetical protein